MTDIVDRLRVGAANYIGIGATPNPVWIEAADEIERLRDDAERYQWLMRFYGDEIRKMLGADRPGDVVQITTNGVTADQPTPSYYGNCSICKKGLDLSTTWAKDGILYCLDHYPNRDRTTDQPDAAP